MFKKISEKLSNDHFVQDTIESNAKARKSQLLSEAMNYKKQSKMTAKDAMCYKKRYNDIGDMTPFKHFVTVG